MSKIYDAMEKVRLGAINDEELDFLLSFKTMEIEDFIKLDPDLTRSSVEFISEIFHAASMFKFSRTRIR